MPFLLMTWLFEDNIFIIKILSIPTKPSFKYNLDIIYYRCISMLFPVSITSPAIS